ncbi:hypothetical protein [Desulfatirhabdium butyrativorans]|uniref:hypothetical protein n=1 Tax=Desulfatirhabdium butyrativorans TaxID=340467 RepID=UPI00041BEB42|nr:hypothetical protein [Desulfatirhabdium butyrativorans]
MLSNDEAIAKFKAIIATLPEWQNLTDSQFVNHMAVFQAWALRDAQYRAERALQEFFISTALNRSSIAAHAEDRGYIPRPPVPSSGTIRITNTGDAPVSLAAGQSFTSNKGISYLIVNPITIAAGAYSDQTAYQAGITTVEADVSASQPFFEIVFDANLSGTIYRIDVYVDDVQWSLARLFQNVDGDALVYDQFFNHLGQSGVRFGNNTFGKQPEAGSHIKCDLWLTDGDTTLLINQRLTPVGAILDTGGNTAMLDIRSITTISGGSSGESTEELKRNLLYWPLYQEQLVWKEDYQYFLTRRFPQIRWINVWGETEAEQSAGELRFEFINKIFVSAYAQGGADISSEIIAALEACKLMNRRFEWVAPDIRSFTVVVTGAVHRKFDSATVRASIEEALLSAYDMESSLRLSAPIRIKDVYRIINDTGYFGDGGYFTAQLAGDYDVTPDLNAVSDIDMSGCSISIGYVS